MTGRSRGSVVSLLLTLSLVLSVSCAFESVVPADETSSSTTTGDASRATVSQPEAVATAPDKWELWTGGTWLRGANIYQRRVYPELDGPEFMAAGSVGPPHTQEDFDQLAALGANYANVSHPGLFTMGPSSTFRLAMYLPVMLRGHGS